MNKILNKISILFIFYLFLIIPVNANINLIFQSDNEKIINTTDIDNGYTQILSNSTNQTLNLSYNNFIFNIYDTNTKITNNNGTFIIKNIKSFNDDKYLILWLAIIIFLIFCLNKFIHK